MARSSISFSSLVDLAEDQGGLFTRQQAKAAGMAWSTLSRMSTRRVMAERVAHGVYRLRGSVVGDDVELRAAWLQLAPDVPTWERTVAQGVISHRSAAYLYGLGHLPADVHEFTLPLRRQSRRSDVRLHRSELQPDEWASFRGMLVTRPSRIAADLLETREDVGAVGYVIADALRKGMESAETIAEALAPLAVRYGFRHEDGVAVLTWLLELTEDPESRKWIAKAKSSQSKASQRESAVHES